jgi:hypothetical protein
MITVETHAEDLLRWARYIDDIPRKTKVASARALNAYGELVRTNAAKFYAEQYDLDVDEVAALIDVKEANPQDLSWSMDASRIVRTDTDYGERNWDHRDTGAFEQQTLVKLVTMEDESVCPRCEEAAANSPYTMGEIDDMRHAWENYEPPTPPAGDWEYTNTVHPRCRCVLQSWTSTRRLEVTFGQPGAAPPELLTGRQFAKKVLEEMAVELKVIP